MKQEEAFGVLHGGCGGKRMIDQSPVLHSCCSLETGREMDLRNVYILGQAAADSFDHLLHAAAGPALVLELLCKSW